ncbi:hypothetical protein CWB85_08500 [Pseudoalteromonas sp. S1727]|uniref:GGDEF domain-containing protein n=1 Tax=Pseudoalteromonas sp. S1727 TaxID=2066514 RepID=UPI0011095CD7|nr:GGDEF domain-containing protein [Pseudoalteromonas sp. S1727]TMN72022.1 hypothetical protein CWB85_08500 [Pseudoalteromonas sp. S1727]
MQGQQGSCFSYLHIRVLLLSIFAYLYLYCAASNAAQQPALDAQWLATQRDLAHEKSVQDPGQATEFLELVLTQQHTRLTPLQRSELQLDLAENYLLLGELTKAIELEKQLANELAVLSNESLINYYLIKSTIHSYSGQADKSLAILKTAEQQVDLLGNDKLRSKVYGALASFYVYNHDDIKALDYFYKSYEIIKRSGDLLDLAYIESTMAKSYEYLFDYDKALQMQHKALAYFLENDLVFDSLVSYFHLAKVYLKMECSQEAIDSSQTMLAMAHKVANENLVYYGYIILAEAYLFEQDITRASHYLALSNQFFDKLEDVANIANHLYIQAAVELAQNLTEQAAQTLAKAQLMSEQIPIENSITSLLKLARLQTKLAVQQNDYQLAYKYQQDFIALNDQHYNKVRELSRSRHKVQFDTKQVELEKQLLKKDKELNEFALLEIKQQQALQNTIMFSVLLLFLLLLLFSWRQYRLKRKFSLLANTDFLTGVANRRKIMDLAELQWLQLKKDNHNFCLIIFDLDHFKTINDEFGHPAGDHVLKAITEISQRAIRDNDVLGRIGGEEFLVVLSNTSRVEAVEIAYRIKSDIEKTQINYGEHVLRMTASFGVAQKGVHLNSCKDLLKNADKALYTAKERGRNRVETDE